MDIEELIETPPVEYNMAFTDCVLDRPCHLMGQMRACSLFQSTTTTWFKLDFAFLGAYPTGGWDITEALHGQGYSNVADLFVSAAHDVQGDKVEPCGPAIGLCEERCRQWLRAYNPDGSEVAEGTSFDCIIQVLVIGC